MSLQIPFALLVYVLGLVIRNTITGLNVRHCVEPYYHSPSMASHRYMSFSHQWRILSFVLYDD
nr:MAG TPA: hypothetical protein [Caudoviricetes sp.]